MKRSIKGLFVILAIIMSLVAVQSVCAETVTGTITSIVTKTPETENMIVLDEDINIYGVKYNYLCNQYDICLNINDEVTIEYYVLLRPNGKVKNMACSITVGGNDPIPLRDCE